MANQQRSTTSAQESTRPITQVALYARTVTPHRPPDVASIKTFPLDTGSPSAEYAKAVSPGSLAQ